MSLTATLQSPSSVASCDEVPGITRRREVAKSRSNSQRLRLLLQGLLPGSPSFSNRVSSTGPAWSLRASASARAQSPALAAFASPGGPAGARAAFCGRGHRGPVSGRTSLGPSSDPGDGAMHGK
jgi:hypothetical protein